LIELTADLTLRSGEAGWGILLHNNWGKIGKIQRAIGTAGHARNSHSVFLRLGKLYIKKGGNEMNDPNWADIMSAVGTLAIATTGAWALLQWKNTLQNQRADECVSAARDLSGDVGRCVTLKSNKPQQYWVSTQEMWHAYDQEWASWRRFDQAFALALRYYKHLPKSIPGEITNKLYDLEAVLRHDLSAGNKQMKLKGTSKSFSVRFISSEPQTKASFESRCALCWLPSISPQLPSKSTSRHA
jgi:hypothetical protein